MKNTKFPVVFAFWVLVGAVLACGQPLPQKAEIASTAQVVRQTAGAAILLPTSPPLRLGQYVVIGDTVNIREMPGGTVIGYVHAGQVVYVIACPSSGWCKLDMPYRGAFVWRGCIWREDESTHWGCR